MSAIVKASVTELAVKPNRDDRFIALFIRTKRSAHTRTAYRYSIDNLLAFVGKPLSALTLEDAVNYHAHLQARYASLASIKLHMDIAKSLFDFGVDLNYLRTNVMKVVKTDTPSPLTHKRILTEEDVLKLISAPAKTRDQLILRLLYAGGLRVSELCNLTWGDLSADGVLHIRQGKGQKDRFVTLSEATVKRLKAFGGALGQLRPEGARDYIFQSQVKQKAGKATGGRLSSVQVHRIVKAAAKRAELDPETSAHWLRHSHGSHALDRGANIVTVRDTLGHASIATTNKYLHSKRGESSALSLAV
jgi:site-specific recombinase XerD